MIQTVHTHGIIKVPGYIKPVSIIIGIHWTYDTIAIPPPALKPKNNWPTIVPSHLPSCN
jgi:hypothetical protein